MGSFFVVQFAVAVIFLMAPCRRQAATESSSSSTASSNADKLATSASIVERWIVVDFDGTCTLRDTTPILPHLASSCAGDSAEERKRRLAAFGELEGQYFDLYEEAKSRVFGGGGGGGGWDREGEGVDRHGNRLSSPTLSEALESLDAASTEVTRRVSASGVLAGISDCPVALEDVLGKDAGKASSSGEGEWSEAAALRPGCAQTLAAAHRAGWHLGVLSINWCPTLIEAALLRKVRSELSQSTDEKDIVAAAVNPSTNRLSRENIWSNAVNRDGVVHLSVPGAAAKRARIASLKATTKGDSCLVVYIGDSSTDLLGLLEADVGILIGRSKTTEAISDRWGVPLVPLAERKMGDGLVEPDKTSVWVAQHWAEIETFLETLSPSSR